VAVAGGSRLRGSRGQRVAVVQSVAIRRWASARDSVPTQTRECSTFSTVSLAWSAGPGRSAGP
jgi:hypothetical protein